MRTRRSNSAVASAWLLRAYQRGAGKPRSHAIISVIVPSAQGTITEMVAWERGFPAPRWYARNNQALATAEFERRVLKKDSE